jgi:two-component system, cell cycle response regulator
MRRRARPDAASTPEAAAREAALEAQSRALTAQLEDLKLEVARNDALYRKTQERELELLQADSLATLLEHLVHGLRASYQLDAVSLVLHDPQHEIRHLLLGDGFALDALQEVQFVDLLVARAPQLAGLERPWLGPFRVADHELLFPGLKGLGSIALIPLRRNGQLDGALVFGSADPRRFSRDLASDFLAHLGVVAAICIENAINRARLMRSGLTDFLTGFHNRRYLHSRLREELARAQRARESVACLMIDVDHFKRINDQHGHLAGDAVLREVAHRLDAEMRVSDTGARFGGDEFAIILAKGGVADGERVAKRALAAVRDKPIVVTPQISEQVTLSIGVAVAAPDERVKDYKALAEALIAAADAALYRVKSAGRNGVAVSAQIVT